jgi:ABC-2 type transport system permease protein
LRFLFTYLLALSAFWGEQAFGIVGFGEVLIFLLGGSAVPIELFPENLRLLGQALPFRGMLGFPSEIASGNVNGLSSLITGFGWQLLWIGVCALMVRVCWQAGIRRYTAVGG